jgi:hypothetical protein
MKHFGGEKMNNSEKPVARKEGLVIQEMPGEVLVYDMQTNKAHCLNETAAFVWRNCTGEKTVDEMVEQFARETGAAVESDLIWLAMDQLSERNLLETSVPARFAGESRRAVLKKIGFASMAALPVIASMAAPTAVMAVGCSGIRNGNAGECTGCEGAPCSCSGSATNGTCQGGICVTPSTTCNSAPPAL